MTLIIPVLLLGLMASLSPATIVVFVLVLGTARARVNAAAFLVGWGVSLTVVFAASYAVGASAPGMSPGGRTSIEVLEVLVGLAMVVAAGRQWRRRDVQPDTSKGLGPDRLMVRLKGLRPVGAAIVGVLKQPWAITAAAAVVVVQHHAAAALVLIAFVCFTVASTATVGGMYAYYALHPGDAEVRLTELRDRAVAAGPRLLAIVGLVVGAFLVVDGLLSLT